jgi:hypothetical protein
MEVMAIPKSRRIQDGRERQIVKTVASRAVGVLNQHCYIETFLGGVSEVAALFFSSSRD